MIPAKLGCCPLRNVAMGTNLRHFRTFFAGADAIFVMLKFQSFDLLYSDKLVVDSFRIVELLQICCTACRGLVLGIRFVADMFRNLS